MPLEFGAARRLGLQHETGEQLDKPVPVAPHCDRACIDKAMFFVVILG